MNTRFALNRYDAAIRLERARQIIRENCRYRFPVTAQHLDAVQVAEREYNVATALLRRRS